MSSVLSLAILHQQCFYTISVSKVSSGRTYCLNGEHVGWCHEIMTGNKEMCIESKDKIDLVCPMGSTGQHSYYVHSVHVYELLLHDIRHEEVTYVCKLQY